MPRFALGTGAWTADEDEADVDVEAKFEDEGEDEGEAESKGDRGKDIVTVPSTPPSTMLQV